MSPSCERPRPQPAARINGAVGLRQWPLPTSDQGLGKQVKDSHLFRKLLAAVSAALLVIFMATGAWAQDTLKQQGPLGALHEKEDVKCARCHGKNEKSVPVPQERCLTCHIDGDSRKLAASTAKVKPLNPHENRHYGTEADCGLCHRQHEKSVNFCLDCHNRFDFKVK